MDRDSDVSLRTDERMEREQPAGSKHRGFWQFWLSLPGLITAIATLVTALTALAALFVHQNQQLNERTEALEQATSSPQPTVTVTATVTATPEPPAVGSGPGPGISGPGVSGPTLPDGSRYLAELDPVDSNTFSYSSEAAVMSNRTYPHSVEVACGDTYLIYNTSGSSQLTATLGVADNASNANGAIADLSFYDQDDRQISKTASVSIAHPATVTLDMTGVVQTKIMCFGRDRVTDERRTFRVIIGDAALTP
ncbi:MAG: hypothetical protein ACRDWG_12785 [Actinomycetes bacterium]